MLLSIGDARADTAEVRQAVAALVARMPETPVLVLSGRGEAQDVIAVLGSGARGYISMDGKSQFIGRILGFLLDGGVIFPAGNKLRTEPTAGEG